MISLWTELHDMRQLGMRLGSGDPSSLLFLGDAQDCLNTEFSSSVSQGGRNLQWGLVPDSILYVRRAWTTTNLATISSVPSPGRLPIFLGYRVIPKDDWGKLRTVNRGQCHLLKDSTKMLLQEVGQMNEKWGWSQFFRKRWERKTCPACSFGTICLVKNQCFLSLFITACSWNKKYWIWNPRW